MSADAVDSGLVRLFEMWTSMDDLRSHVQRMQSSPPAEGGVPVLARDMKIYVHAEEQPFGA
jgi:quinol monooxygenase YgiN